jgi:hypothetical protein
MADSSETSAASETQAAPVFVVVEGVSAGVAVREGRGLRFRALHPRFEILDGSRFAHADHLRRAAGRLARATRD